MSCAGPRSAATPGSRAAWPFDEPERKATCATCGEVTAKFTTKFPANSSTPVITCSVCENPRHSLASGQGGSFFDELVLDHVHDESGQPVRVSSVRQLREAEKRYNFRHHAANMDQANWDKPPQAPSGSIQDNIKWLHPELAERMLKDPNIQAEMKRDREVLLKKLV